MKKRKTSSSRRKKGDLQSGSLIAIAVAVITIFLISALAFYFHVM